MSARRPVVAGRMLKARLVALVSPRAFVVVKRVRPDVTDAEIVEGGETRPIDRPGQRAREGAEPGAQDQPDAPGRRRRIAVQVGHLDGHRRHDDVVGEGAGRLLSEDQLVGGAGHEGHRAARDRTGVVMLSVLVSAFVDLSEQVDTPEALVNEQAPGCWPCRSPRTSGDAADRVVEGVLESDGDSRAGGAIGDDRARPNDRRVGGRRCSDGDAVSDRAAGVVVVAADVGERPRVGRVAAGRGVGRARQVEPGQAAVGTDALAGAGGGVAEGVVGDAVARDRAAVGVGLGDAVSDRAAGVVVVAADVGERPRIGRVAAGRGVGRARQVEPGQAAVGTDALAGAGGGVAEGVVGDAVARDRAAVGVGLGDAVSDRAAGVVVVAADVGERPRDQPGSCRPRCGSCPTGRARPGCRRYRRPRRCRWRCG